MIIKQTPWERANLGVETSAVFQFDEQDTVDMMDRSILDNRDYVYQEAVIPMNKIDILNLLLKNGFRFAEVAIHVAVSLKEPLELPPFLVRRIQKLNYHRASDEECERIYASMMEGDIFTTDKIALNPAFGPKVAGRRYARWARSEVNLGKAVPYIVQCEAKPIGFTILQLIDDTKAGGMLSGIFDAKEAKGFGFSLVFFLMVEAQRLGKTKLVTTISSNNPPIYKIDELLGFKIQGMNYLLTKMNTQSSTLN